MAADWNQHAGNKEEGDKSPVKGPYELDLLGKNLHPIKVFGVDVVFWFNDQARPLYKDMCCWVSVIGCLGEELERK